MENFSVDNILWCNDLENDNLDVEVSLAVTVDEERERLIPEESQFLIFVTVNPSGISKIEEIALGSDKKISLLSEKELETAKKYVWDRYYTEIVPEVIRQTKKELEESENSSITRIVAKRMARKELIKQRILLFSTVYMVYQSIFGEEREVVLLSCKHTSKHGTDFCCSVHPDYNSALDHVKEVMEDYDYDESQPEEDFDYKIERELIKIK